MNHILVVDDEPLMRTWLSKSIPKHSTCFDVPNTAQDGIEAIDYLKQAAYDVVITDIKMPGMDGLNLAKFIQENYPDTVVIITSVLFVMLASNVVLSTLFPSASKTYS